MGIYVLFSQLDCELIHSCNKHSLNQALDIVTCIISFNPPSFSMKVLMPRHCVWGRTALVLKDLRCKRLQGLPQEAPQGEQATAKQLDSLCTTQLYPAGSEEGVKPSPLCAHQTTPCSIGLGPPAATNTFPSLEGTLACQAST